MKRMFGGNATTSRLFDKNQATDFERNLAVGIIAKAVDDYLAGPGPRNDARLRATRRLAYHSAVKFMFGVDAETVTYREWLLSLTSLGSNFFAMVRRKTA